MKNNNMDVDNEYHIFENLLIKLAETTAVSESLSMEKELLEAIISLPKDTKKRNSELLQPLHLYFIALYNKGRLALDSSADNPSISLFTDYFLKNKKMVLERFKRASLQKVIMTLVLDNLSIHRNQHATEILQKYMNIFSEEYKAMMYIRVLNASCGSLDISLILDLFDKSKNTYTRIKSLSEKADFLYKIYYISKGTLVDNPHMDYLLNEFFKESNGHCDGKIRNVFREFCLNKEYPEETKEWLKSLSDIDLSPNDKSGIAEIEYILKEKQEGKDHILAMLTGAKEDNPDEAHLIANIKRHYSDKTYSSEELFEDIEKGIEFYTNKKESTEDINEITNAFIIKCELELMKPAVDYWCKQERNYKRIEANESNKISDNIFIVINEYSLVNAATTFPFLLEAKRRGIPCYSFSPKIHLDTCDPSDSFYNLYGMINDGRDKRYLPNNDISDVEIDIDNKRIIAKGMNIYQPIFEIVSRYQFTYEYRFETDAWARYKTVFLIRKFLALFNYIERVEEWSVANNKKVYFISNAPHIHNAAAFRIYCEDKGYKSNLNFICTSPGYDNYFINSTDPRSLTTTALNMTEFVDCRNSFLGTKEGFENYYQSNKYRIEEIRKKMQEYLEARRSNKAITFRQRIDKQVIINKIKKAHRKGKTVILLNGKVIIDLGVKYTKGCVHSDMSDWITHAVSFANENSKDVLLLIKPHPHENRQDLTMTSEKIDNLRSIIHTDVGAAIYLDNNLFTNFELAPYVDLCMVWNGTSAVEFAAEGKKVLVADEWGHKDYPIGFFYPKSLEEYETCMTDINQIKEAEDLRDRAITFLEYIGSDDVRIKNDYSQTTLMNFNQNESVINENAVNRFIEKGDKELEKYFERLL